MTFRSTNNRRAQTSRGVHRLGWAIAVLGAMLAFPSLSPLPAFGAARQAPESGAEEVPRPATTLRSIKAARVAVPPKIDGALDDPCWKALPSADGFSDVRLGTLVQDETTAWIGYDDTAVYVAFYCHDSDPHAIVARETKRGAGFYDEDRVRFRLNPFNSRRGDDENEMNVNPLGTHFDQFVGGHAAKQEWEGEWESAAKIVSDGWTCEMAIPWRCFVRPATGGKPVTLGINFERFQARTQVYSYWSNLGPKERRELGGEWTGVVLPPPDKTNPLSLLTYSYGGYDGNRSLEKSGLDLRYKASPLLTGVGTLNPDLSNVENAVTSIDFSYSERLAAETRPFFLEGGDYYNWGISGVSPFASQRIETFDVGGKFYGRLGERTDMGLLTTDDIGHRNDGVLYVKHTLSPFDTVSFQAVRRGDAEARNDVFAAKAKGRRGDWSASAGYTRSFDAAPDEAGTPYQAHRRGDAAALSLNWDKDAWNAWANASAVSPGYIARDGYVPFTDQRGASAGFGYRNEWHSGPVREFGWGADTFRYAHYDGDFFRGGASAGFDLETSGQLKVYAHYAIGRYRPDHNDNAPEPDIVYDDRTATIGLGYPTMNKFQNYGIRYSWGRLGGSAYADLSPYVNWRFFNRLSLSLSSEIVRHDGTAQQHVLGLSYDIAPDKGIGGRLVRRGSRTNWYLSFRRSGYGGTEAFVILGDPNAETFTRRLILKVVRPM